MSVLDRSALTESPLADLHAIASELSIDGYRRLRRPELIDAILAKQSGGEAQPARSRRRAPADEAPRRRGARRARSRVAAPGEPSRSRARRADADRATDRRRAGRRRADDGRRPTERRPTDGRRAPTGSETADDDDEDAGGPRRRRGRRGGRGRGSAARTDAEAEPDGEPAEEDKPARGARVASERRRAAERRATPRAAPEEGEQLVEGVVELLANGSGLRPRRSAGSLRRRRLHLLGAGQALRARLR